MGERAWTVVVARVKRRVVRWWRCIFDVVVLVTTVRFS